MRHRLILPVAYGLSLIAGGGGSGPALAASSLSPKAHKAVKPAADSLSSSGERGRRLAFEVNKGQAEKKTRFLTHGKGYRLSLTPQGAVLDLAPFEAASEGETRFSPLRIRLLESNRRPALRGAWKAKERTVQLLGRDAKPRRKTVPTFEKVVYEKVYPGINLVFYGQPDRLEYDFILDPRAKPERIRMTFEGAERIELTEAGELLMETPVGRVRQMKPFLYQVIGGVQREVSGGYRLDGDGGVGFEVGPYDPAHHLVIDPVLIVTPPSAGVAKR